jgi:outer membrane protein OmpA-like peptidoglycan-associated protein
MIFFSAITNKRILYAVLNPLLCTLLLIFATNQQAQAQKNYSGVWQGVLTQPHDTETLSNNYAFWLDIKQTKNIITGHCRIEVAQTSNFAIIQFKGKITDSTLVFQQYQITHQKIEKHAHWCLLNSKLYFNEQDNSLRGNWQSLSAGCSDGEIIVFKSEQKFNALKAQTNVYVALDSIKVKLRKQQSVIDKKIVLQNIFFDTNQTTLKTASSQTLDELYNLLQQFPKLRIKVTGHTDAIGDDGQNLKLSMGRAKAVIDYLTAKGIEPRRLTSEGFGESRPLADNGSEIGREENRRVEFEIIGQ